MGSLKVLAKVGDQSVFTKFRAATCHCFASLLLSLFSRHDPFIVSSAKLVHRAMVSLSFAHPCRCSRPTLTFVCFCAAHPVPARVSGCPIILQWSVGPTVSRTPILQTCNVVVASFQHLHLHLELVLVPIKTAYQCVSCVVLLPIDPSKNLTYSCHLVVQPPLKFQILVF